MIFLFFYCFVVVVVAVVEVFLVMELSDLPSPPGRISTSPSSTISSSDWSSVAYDEPKRGVRANGTLPPRLPRGRPPARPASCALPQVLPLQVLPQVLPLQVLPQVLPLHCFPLHSPHSSLRCFLLNSPDIAAGVRRVMRGGVVGRTNCLDQEGKHSKKEMLFFITKMGGQRTQQQQQQQQQQQNCQKTRKTSTTATTTTTKQLKNKEKHKLSSFFLRKTSFLLR